MQLDSLYTGTPFDMETPDGPLSDAIGGEQLLEDMYMIQEELVGGLSFWPNIQVQSLLGPVIVKARRIFAAIPHEYPLTRQGFEEFIQAAREAEARCTDLYAVAFGGGR